MLAYGWRSGAGEGGATGGRDVSIAERLREALACETCRCYRQAAVIAAVVLMVSWLFT